jgi:hypothetical protein
MPGSKYYRSNMVKIQTSDTIFGIMWLFQSASYFSVPNRGADTFIILKKKSQIPPFHDLYFTLILLMPARLFGTAFLFGTLEYITSR